MSQQQDLDAQSDISIEELGPHKEKMLLQDEELEENILQINVVIKMLEEFGTEQADNQAPTNRDPLEILVRSRQDVLSDTQLYGVVKTPLLEPEWTSKFLLLLLLRGQS